MPAPETIDSRTHRVLAGVSRVAVLQALRVNGGLLGDGLYVEQSGVHTQGLQDGNPAHSGKHAMGAGVDRFRNGHCFPLICQ